MSAPAFIVWNGDPSALTAPMAGTVLTTATTKTVLQIAPVRKIRVVAYGFHFAAVPASPVRVELLETDVAATVTAGVVGKYNDASGDAADVTVSTTGTGFNASAEGSITATRLLAQEYEQGGVDLQFPLGREIEVGAGKFLRVRATQSTGSDLTIYTYVVFER